MSLTLRIMSVPVTWNASNMMRFTSLYKSSSFFISNSSSQNVCVKRYYRRFTRIPVKVNPASKDMQKMRIEEYVNNTKANINQEVKEEMDKLNKGPMGNVTSSFMDHTAYEKHQNIKKRDRYEDIEQDQTFSEERKMKLNVKLFNKAPVIYRSLLKNCRTGRLRKENNILMLDTPTLIQEAMSAGLTPTAIYFSRLSKIIKIKPKTMDSEQFLELLNSCPLFRTPYKDITLCSNLSAHPGIIGVFTQSDATEAYNTNATVLDESQNAEIPCTVLLDSVREPGNLGSIFRTVAAAGIRRVILTKGCCSPWESKALRAASGAHFTLNIISDVEWDSIYNHVSEEPTVYISDICNSDREPLKLEDEENQTEGEHKDDAFEIERQLQLLDEKKKEEKDEGNVEVKPLLSNKNELTVHEKDDEIGTFLVDESFNDPIHLSEYESVTLPSSCYKDIQYFNKVSLPAPDELVIIFGSERGLTSSSKKFAVDNYGSQISIPLNNNVESLNTSVASGVILYEVLNQFKKIVN